MSALRPNVNDRGERGGRKGNANHLLGFSLPARVERAPAPRRSRKNGGGEGARWQIFNKEKFVNASFRFMMKPTGDYTAYFSDSDIFFHWPDILQVLMPSPAPSILASLGADSSESSTSSAPKDHLALPNCPICLGVPVASRMTKCGHVYCFPCILHFLALSDDKYAKCPICNDSIYSRDLKCVTWTPILSEPELPPTSPSISHFDDPHSHHSHSHDHHDIPSDFEDIPPPSASSKAPKSAFSSTPSASTHLLRLMQRPQHTTLALPRSLTWPSPAVPPHEAPYHFLPDISTFARFMLATPNYLVSQLQRDIRELADERRSQMQAGEGGVGLGFIDAARKKVEEQIERAEAELGTEGVWRKIREVNETVEGLEKKGVRDREREEKRIAREKELEAAAAASSEAASTLSAAGVASPSLKTLFPDSEATLPHSLSSIPTPSSTASLNPNTPSFQPAQTPHALLAHLGHNWAPPVAPPPPASSTSTHFLPSTSPSKSSLLNPNHPPRQPLKPARGKTSLAPPPEPSFFFYQSYSGQQIYLHPLDIRVLLAEYKSYSAFPELLRVSIEGGEEGTMNEDLRRRCKYLSHLPTGCSIFFLETDLVALVSPSTLAAFEAPLRQRRQRRRERGKREERERKKAEEKEREEREAGNFVRVGSGMSSISGGGGGGMGGYIRGDDDFEEALQRSLRDDPTLGSSFPPHALSTSPPSTSSPSSSYPPASNGAAWGGASAAPRSFANALHSHSAGTYGRGEPKRSKEEEEEIAALWARLESEDRAERGGRAGGGGGGDVRESSTGSAGGGIGAGGGVGGGKKKKKGQKVLLTGGGGRGTR